MGALFDVDCFGATGANAGDRRGDLAAARNERRPWARGAGFLAGRGRFPRGRRSAKMSHPTATSRLSERKTAAQRDNVAQDWAPKVGTDLAEESSQRGGDEGVQQVLAQSVKSMDDLSTKRAAHDLWPLPFRSNK